MKWNIEYSRDADRFIDKQDIRAEVREQLEFFLRKMRGESISIDVKKLKGEWKGYFRIRKGRLRVIFSVDFNDRVLYVERVDFRGKAYK
jgi:mRNA-degrading endonuclease RelE of RelBE toxin-antitoxin system